MRAVCDPNVLVSALISATGAPREIVDAWIEERFELAICPMLLSELRDVLARPKLARWVDQQDAAAYLSGLEKSATMLDDPAVSERISPDPDDDYLVFLARQGEADFLVSGDRHLTELLDSVPPVLTPRQFADKLA
jgi:putative PIN family toxin of toxin-antitoxin system